MSQVTAALTLNDGAATPVAKTFAVAGVSPAHSVFQERSAGASAGFIQLVVDFDPANGGRKTNKVRIKLDYPILETVSGVTQVTRKGLFDGSFVIPDTFTAAERANLQAFTQNALAHAMIKAVVKDLDPMY